MSKKHSVKLQYLGCSAFVLSDADGTAVALDLWTPQAFRYAEDTPDELGLGEAPALSTLLVSHDHKDHSFTLPKVPVVFGVQSRKVVDTPHLVQVGSISIGKFTSYHYTTKAKHPKINTVFALTVAGVTVVHLGDAHGTMVDESLLRALKQKIGTLDILLLPIGTPWRKPVDIDTLDLTISVMNPRGCVPMHYWSVRDKQEVMAGLAHRGYQPIDLQDNSFVFSTDDLPQIGSRTIWNITAGKFHCA